MTTQLHLIQCMKKIAALALLLVFHQQVDGQPDLQKGLVAWFPFNGNANDQSGKGNNPVSNNATLAEDRFGRKEGAYLFNGESNFIQVKNSLTLCPEELTIIAIVKPMGLYKGPCYGNSILDKGSQDGIPGFYCLRFSAAEYTQGDCNDGDPEHQAFNSMARSSGNTSQNEYIKLGTWYYLVYTFNKDHSRLYVDGELVSSSPSKAKLGKNNEDLFIGKKNNSSYPYWFNGVIDEIRIYNRALNSEETYELYQQLSKKE